MIAHASNFALPTFFACGNEGWGNASSDGHLGNKGRVRSREAQQARRRNSAAPLEHSPQLPRRADGVSPGAAAAGLKGSALCPERGATIEQIRYRFVRAFLSFLSGRFSGGSCDGPDYFKRMGNSAGHL